jgi:hypothetical protein
MSTTLDNNLEGPKPPDCEVMKNDSNNKQHNNQTNGANKQDDKEHSTDNLPPISFQPPLRPQAYGGIIIDFDHLKVACDKHLLKCIICNKGKPELVRESTTGFATKLAVSCKNCKEKEKKLYNSISYLTKKINAMTIDDIKTSQDKHCLQMKVRYNEKKLDIYRKRLDEDCRIYPTQSNTVASKNEGSGKHASMSYNINVRSMLCAFYLGTSGYDIERMSTFLGFNGGLGFERMFHRSMNEVVSKLVEICSEIILEAREKEIEETIKDKQQHSNNSNLQFDKVGITASYDMGWSKRSSGRHFDSMTGHGFLIGGRTKNVIAMGVMKKRCRICMRSSRCGVEPPVHSCVVNHFGSSGAMESTLALKLTKQIFEDSKHRVYLEEIVTDDDSTLRSHLQNEHKGGKLPDMIPQPKFLADPSHRIKVMISPIFKLVTKTKDPSKCKNLDALRLKKYTGCYFSQSRNKPLKEFISSALAPVEHLFNSHTWCDPSWCWAKSLDDVTYKYYTDLMKDSVSQSALIGLSCSLLVFNSHSLFIYWNMGTHRMGFYRFPSVMNAKAMR